MTQHSSFKKLEQRLVLLAWLNGHFGYDNNRDLLADMKEAAEGFDASGRSYVYHRLEARGGKVKIPLADLACYDDNVREHLQLSYGCGLDASGRRCSHYLGSETDSEGKKDL